MARADPYESLNPRMRVGEIVAEPLRVDHEMKSNGRPDRRIDRMERILAWFDRYLREGRRASRSATSG